MKKFLFGSLIIGILPLAVFAAEFKSGDQYLLRSGDVVTDSLYVAGGNINVEGDVTGDLLAAGGTVNISGNVAKSAMLAGGTVNVTGNVSESIRAVGGEVTIAGNIRKDVVVAGGKVRILPGATIGGDLVMAGGDLKNDGLVHGAVRVYAKRHVERPDNQGWAGFLAGAFILWWLIKVAMGLLLGLILFYFVKNSLSMALHDASAHFWREVLRGFIILILLPIAMITAFVTIIGIPLGVLALLIYIGIAMVASVVGGALLGSYLWRWVKKEKGVALSWQSVAVGIIIYELLKLIPVVGWMVVFIFFLASFGSIFNLFYWRKI